jgi:hypothetical protein
VVVDAFSRGGGRVFPWWWTRFPVVVDAFSRGGGRVSPVVVDASIASLPNNLLL